MFKTGKNSSPLVAIALFLAPTLVGCTTNAAAQTAPPAPNQQKSSTAKESEASLLATDPLLLTKVIDRVTQRRLEFDKVLTEVRAKMGKMRPSLPNATGELEVIETFQKKVIPGLRAWRSEVLSHRGKIFETQIAYVQALQDAIQVLEKDAAAIEFMVSPSKDQPSTIRSQVIKDQFIKLAGRMKNLVPKYTDRLKGAQIATAEVQEFLLFCEDSGALLDRWDNTLKVMVEAGIRGEEAQKHVEGLRLFASSVLEALDRFLEFSDKLNAADPPAAPVLEKQSLFKPKQGLTGHRLVVLTPPTQSIISGAIAQGTWKELGQLVQG